MNTQYRIVRKYETMETKADPNARPNWYYQEHVIDEIPVFGTKAQVGFDFVRMLDQTERELQEGKLGTNHAIVILKDGENELLKANVYDDWRDPDAYSDEVDDKVIVLRKVVNWLAEENQKLRSK